MAHLPLQRGVCPPKNTHDRQEAAQAEGRQSRQPLPKGATHGQHTSGAHQAAADQVQNQVFAVGKALPSERPLKRALMQAPANTPATVTMPSVSLLLPSL